MRRHVVRRVLAVVTVVLLVGAVALAGYALRLRSAFDETRHTLAAPFPTTSARPSIPPGRAAHAQNILVVGTDSRDARGTGPRRIARQQADAMVVVHVSADRKRLSLLTIGRNVRLESPSGGTVPAYRTLGDGGVPGVVGTIERTVGVRMDHVAVLSFAGLVGLTDALGGVTVDNPQAFRVLETGEVFRAGRIELKGQRALAFVRGTRDPGPGGDAVRSRNQQEFLRAVLRTLLTPQTLADPGKTSAVVQRFSRYLRVDEGLSADYLVGLSFSMASVRARDVRFVTMPSADPSAGSAAGLDAIRAAFRRDTVERLAR